MGRRAPATTLMLGHLAWRRNMRARLAGRIVGCLTLLAACKPATAQSARGIGQEPVCTPCDLNVRRLSGFIVPKSVMKEFIWPGIVDMDSRRRVYLGFHPEPSVVVLDLRGRVVGHLLLSRSPVGKTSILALSVAAG